MITNLIATIVVTLVTNVTVTDNAQTRWEPRPCPGGPENAIHAVACGETVRIPGSETERTETEIVNEKTTLRIVHDGATNDIPKGEREVRRRTRVSKLRPADWAQDEWAEAQYTEEFPHTTNVWIRSTLPFLQRPYVWTTNKDGKIIATKESMTK